MSRHFIALTVLALAGTSLILPSASAGPSGIPGGARTGGFRAMVIHPNARAGLLRPTPRPYGTFARHTPAYGTIPPRASFAPPGSLTGTRFVSQGLGRDIGAEARSRVVRRHYRGVIAGTVYPFTLDGYGYAPYLGTPYDPAEAIPVYGPSPVYAVPADDEAGAQSQRPSAAPRLSSAGDETPDACRSERVTVPESKGEGEREILVVRC